MKHSYDYSSRFRILKGGKISLIVSALLTSMSLLQAAPSGGVVTAGNASIAQNGSVTNITQTTTKAAINWQNFSIGSSETVNFNQPNVSSITLNRVVGNEKSVIDGALNANGQVFILNSNGVLFSKNASINTAGLVATTMNLSDTDFMNGTYAFKGDSSASIINQGTINISDKGYAALFGTEVKNEGFIKATLGKVELVGAKEVTLNLNGNSLVKLKVDKGVLDALIENKGAIYADGGEVYLTTNAVGELLKGVVNNTGIIEANSIDDITGKVELYAHGGEVQVGGTLEADGGFIETSGKDFTILKGATIKTAQWLIDPVDITIDSALATTIESALTSADVTIETTSSGASTVVTTGSETSSDGDTTDGDIYVNSNITWSTDKKLTLKADDQIYVNATIKNTNNTNGGVYFNANNTTDKVIFGTNGLVSIYNVYQFQWISQALNGKYKLGSNINASATSTWNSSAGFVPIGNATNKFSGTFDGQGYVINALTINRPTTDNVGLFGVINTGATVQNIGLTNVNIIGQVCVGGLAGQNYGTISNSYATGTISGTGNVGGLVGFNSGTISNSYATGTVSGTSDYVGGLVGQHRTGAITNSYATGNVSGISKVGGLVGWIFDGTITNVYATGNVTGQNQVGGLVGLLQYGASPTSITNAYATGVVSGAKWVGGLVGTNNSGSISNVYATGDVSGTQWVGGLVGYNYQGTITKAYATGSVPSSGTNVGGFVGENYGTITASFWNTQTSGTTTGVGTGTSTGVTGKTTAEMQDPLLYTNAGWDTTIWTYGSDATVAGYAIGLAYLKNVTAVADRPTLFSGGYGTSANPYTITNWTQLQNMNYNSDVLTHGYYFSLLNNLNNTTAGYATIASTTANSGAGFNPIGNNPTLFTGSFDGQGHTIDSLYINRPMTDNVGLFSIINTGATVQNIGLTNVNITGKEIVGGLAGQNYKGSITNAYATGSVSGTTGVGGLVGYSEGSITNAYATSSVSGMSSVGGLVGVNYLGGTISNAYSTGSVSGSSDVGGLVGYNYQGTITKAYATGSVSGQSFVGGFAGYNNGTITASFWDTQTSGQATSAGGTGKTTEQMQQVSTFRDAGWDIDNDSALAVGTPVLSMNGTPIWKIRTHGAPTPTPDVTPPTQDLTPIITQIVNGTAITPPVLPNFVPPTLPIQAPQQFSVGGQMVQLVSIPSSDVPNQLVGAQEARAMIQGGGAGEFRVPLGQNSLIQLINGGVKLPVGLEQQFFMAQR